MYSIWEYTYLYIYIPKWFRTKQYKVYIATIGECKLTYINL